MKLEDILSEWKIDSQIDQTQLDHESIKIPKLHHKYYEIYVHERLNLMKQESQYKKLKLEKYEFFTQGPNEETIQKGWELPPKGILLKSDVNMYLEADSDLIELSLKIGLQQEKVELLQNIIKSLTNRGFNIKSAIDFIRFQSGA